MRYINTIKPGALIAGLLSILILQYGLDVWFLHRFEIQEAPLFESMRQMSETIEIEMPEHEPGIGRYEFLWLILLYGFMSFCVVTGVAGSITAKIARQYQYRHAGLLIPIYWISYYMLKGDYPEDDFKFIYIVAVLISVLAILSGAWLAVRITRKQN